MKKMLINRLPVDGPWGGGNNFVKALYDHGPTFGFTPVFSLDQSIDLIFMVDPRYDNMKISINEIAEYKKRNPGTKVVYRINECDKRKGQTNEIDPVIRTCSSVTDMCIFISNWIMNYHTRGSWFCEKNFTVYSGTNKDHFYPQEKKNNGKVNIVTHHWSDNPLKGQDIYEALDDWVGRRDDFTFTYIGRTKSRLLNSTIIAPKFGEELGRELSKNDVYVSASRFDPGPNHIIESLACEIPTYAHTDSGGAAEMVGSSHTYRSLEEILEILLSKDFEKNNVFTPVEWEKCLKSYFDHIKMI